MKRDQLINYLAPLKALHSLIQVVGLFAIIWYQGFLAGFKFAMLYGLFGSILSMLMLALAFFISQVSVRQGEDGEETESLVGIVAISTAAIIQSFMPIPVVVWFLQ